MLVATSFFSPPTPIKHSYVGKSFTKASLPITSNIHPKVNNFSMKNIDNRNSRFSRRCHPPPSELVASDREEVDAGIGILEFFAGKNIFVTGATGLLGKG